MDETKPGVEVLRMIRVTSEDGRRWGEELHKVAVRRQFDNEPFAAMGPASDVGAQELFLGYQKGFERDDRSLSAKANPYVKKAFDKWIVETSGLMGKWSGSVEVPVVGIYGLGVRIGEIDRAERGGMFGRPGDINTSSEGLMDKYRRKLTRDNPKLVLILDAVLTGFNKGGKNSGWPKDES